jgi:hypothetical protein
MGAEMDAVALVDVDLVHGALLLERHLGEARGPVEEAVHNLQR